MYSCYLKIKKKTYDKYIFGLINIFQKELERKLQKKIFDRWPLLTAIRNFEVKNLLILVF